MMDLAEAPAVPADLASLEWEQIAPGIDIDAYAHRAHRSSPTSSNEEFFVTTLDLYARYAERPSLLQTLSDRSAPVLRSFWIVDGAVTEEELTVS